MPLKNKDDYCSFLLRLWLVKGNGEKMQRLSLEDVHSGEKHLFASLEELQAYLSEVIHSWGEALGNDDQSRNN